MSNPISEDCSSGLHDYCTPCQCECHPIEYLTKEELLVIYNLLKHQYIDYENEPAIKLIRKINDIVA